MSLAQAIREVSWEGLAPAAQQSVPVPFCTPSSRRGQAPVPAGEGWLGSDYVNDVFATGSTVYAATIAGLSISTDNGANWTNYTTADGLSSDWVQGVYAIGATIYAAFDADPGGLSISTDGGVNWTTYGTANGLGSEQVLGVFAAGSDVYAATRSGLSIGVAAVPEPSTYAMALAGLACGGFSMWRRRQRV